jgi:hypothetical protein
MPNKQLSNVEKVPVKMTKQKSSTSPIKKSSFMERKPSQMKRQMSKVSTIQESASSMHSQASPRARSSRKNSNAHLSPIKPSSFFVINNPMKQTNTIVSGKKIKLAFDVTAPPVISRKGTENSKASAISKK